VDSKLNNEKEQKMKKRTIKGIDCYGDIHSASYFEIVDEGAGHVMSAWHFEEDREFHSWKEAVNYLIDNFHWHGEIQEIGAEA